MPQRRSSTFSSAVVPHKVERYRFVRHLGSGAYGDVWMCIDEETQREYAIKVLPIPKLSTSIRREISVMRMLDHPNIVRLERVVKTEKRLYLVQELVRGGDLFDAIGDDGICETVAKMYMKDVLTGIAHCHEHGIVIRDVKPENLLLTEQGSVKICDFGLSKTMRASEMHNTVCGTLVYGAPELFGSDPYPLPPLDIWACGVTMYVMLCGSLPFENENDHSTVQAIREGRYMTPAHFSPPARDLIALMLQVNPAARPTAVEALAHPWLLF